MRPLAEVCLIAAFLLPAGCGFFSLGGPSLTSSDPALKIPAIKAAGETRDHRAIPDLIDALASPDPAVRLYAINALRHITGHTFGYVAYASPAQRRAAIARWRRYCRTASPGRENN